MIQSNILIYLWGEESKTGRGGHLTITHQMLASTFREFAPEVCSDLIKNREKICARLF